MIHMNLQNSNRLIDSENKFIVAGDGGGMGEWWGKRQRVWDGHVHTAIFKVDNQQGPTV